MFHVFCLFLCLEKMVSHCVSLSFKKFFFLTRFLYVPKMFKSCCFLGKNVGKTLFSVSDLLVSKTFVWEKSVLFFHYFLKLLILISFLFALKQPKFRQKSFIFCSVSLCFIFSFNIFPFFFLSSPLSLFTFSLFLFPLFSILSFSLSQCFSFSFFVSHVSLSVFFSIAVFAYPLFCS